MNLIVSDIDNINHLVSEEIINLINKRSRVVLGLATGSTPLGVYKLLIKAYKDNRVSFKNVRTFNLDEYVGLDDKHNNSYRYFMNYNFFNQIDINLEDTSIPSVDINSDNYYLKYDKKIEDHNGIDLQLLGIGSNGHIAFNEPGTSFESLTHIVDLKQSTLLDNSRFFNSIDEVPKKAVTMGLKSVMNAKRIILIAFGKNKAKAIYDLFKKEESVNLPASILKKHNHVTVFVDEEAYSYLK